MKPTTNGKKDQKPVARPNNQTQEEIKTDAPLSEKDEVKQAEQNTNTSVKKKH